VLVFEDPTNLDLRFARNALRHEVMPALRRAGVARNLDHSLLSLARTARAASAVLDAQARRLLRERSRQAIGWRVELDLRGLGDDDLPFFEEGLRLLDLRLRGAAGPSPATVLRRVRAELWTAPAGRRVHGKGPHALLFERTRDGILVLDPSGAGAPPAAPLEVDAGETQRFGHTEWFVTSTTYAEPPHEPPQNASDAHRIVLDLRSAPPPWFLRTRRSGDRFQPVGMTRAIDLRRYLQSHHVPRFHRDRLPLLVDDRDRILWIPGAGVAVCAALPPVPRSCVEWRVAAR
jgi:tRNA(Ile)-lysidine synthase